jgi:hypothetical protein
MDSNLKVALDTLTMLATARGMSFAGMMIGETPPALFLIGNVSEKGHDLADLFRLYADLIDKKTTAGKVQPGRQTCGLVN